MDEFFDKVKGYANIAKDEATKITKQVVDKTNNIMSQTKLNFSINETEGKIKEIYEAVGEKAYKKYVGGAEPCECMKESFEKLDELKSELADLNEKLAELKQSVKCTGCGEANSKTAKFCANCGAAMSDAVDEFVDTAAYEDDVIEINPKKSEEDE